MTKKTAPVEEPQLQEVEQAEIKPEQAERIPEAVRAGPPRLYHGFPLKSGSRKAN